MTQHGNAFTLGVWTTFLTLSIVIDMKTTLTIIGIIAAAAFVLYTAYLMYRGWREENEE